DYKVTGVQTCALPISSHPAVRRRRRWRRGFPGGVGYPPFPRQLATGMGDGVLNRRHPMADERMHEECGLFGIDAPGEDVANLTRSEERRVGKECRSRV